MATYLGKVAKESTQKLSVDNQKSDDDLNFDLTGVDEDIAQFTRDIDALDTVFPPLDFEEDLAAFSADLDYLGDIL